MTPTTFAPAIALLLVAGACSTSDSTETGTSVVTAPSATSARSTSSVTRQASLPTVAGLTSSMVVNDASSKEVPQSTTSTTEIQVEPVSYFATTPPGEPLRSGEECAALVRPVAENVPENTPYNATVGTRVAGRTYLSHQVPANHLEDRVDGNFTGTTDEIIQWAACKWGFDEDLIRAQAYTESRWFAGWLGDCGVDARVETGGDGGCASTGLLQVKSAERTNTVHPGTWPYSWMSTAFNIDYALAVQRACYEGLEPWLADAAPNGDIYRAGDQLGCMGRWFSGQWRDDGALEYLTVLRANLDGRRWETTEVGCADWETTFYCSGLDR